MSNNSILFDRLIPSRNLSRLDLIFDISNYFNQKNIYDNLLK